MTEHQDNFGTDIPGEDRFEDVSQPDLTGHADIHGISHGIEHDLEHGPLEPEHAAVPLEHPHDDQAAHDLAWTAHMEAEHLHDAETDAPDRLEAAVQRSAAATALSAPGGTVFAPAADPEPSWLGVSHDPSELGLALERSYSASWAADDGTGVSTVLLVADRELESEHWDAPEGLAEAIPGQLDAVLYGDGPDSARDGAERLWEELTGGAPLPAGEGGEPLSADALLNTLSKRLDDPMALSVVDAALDHFRSEVGW